MASWYAVQLVRRPVLTKTVTAVIITAAGDAACQALERREAVRRGDRPPRYDIPRTVRMGTWALLMTPAVHLWYASLMTRFPTSPLKRMLADQLIWAPAGLVAFFVAMGVMETGRWEDGWRKTQASFVPVMAANWLVWPAVQYANFRFTPPQYQVLVVNFVSFFWAMYISAANAKASENAAAATPAKRASPYLTFAQGAVAPTASLEADANDAALESVETGAHRRGGSGASATAGAALARGQEDTQAKGPHLK